MTRAMFFLSIFWDLKGLLLWMICLRIGNYWGVEGLFRFFCVKDVLLYGGWRHVGFLKVLPDDVDGEVGGMAHVAGVESVVAKLVDEYFVGWVVEGIVVGGGVARERVEEALDGKMESAFANLVLVEAVGYMAYGADGKNGLNAEVCELLEQGMPGVEYLLR